VFVRLENLETTLVEVPHDAPGLLPSHELDESVPELVGHVGELGGPGDDDGAWARLVHQEACLPDATLARSFFRINATPRYPVTSQTPNNRINQDKPKSSSTNPRKR
jgi:hypothetical protein